eukprot:1150780-Pyramimonas_sp.AAC.1
MYRPRRPILPLRRAPREAGTADAGPDVQPFAGGLLGGESAFSSGAPSAACRPAAAAVRRRRPSPSVVVVVAVVRVAVLEGVVVVGRPSW